MGKGGGSKASAAAALQSSGRAGRLAKQGAPVRKEVFRQALMGLKGEAVNIPGAQRGVEATKAATSQALAAQEKGLAGLNLGGTPFGQMALGQTRQMGAFQASQVPGQIAEQAIARAMGLQGPTLGAMGVAGQTAAGAASAADQAAAARQSSMASGGGAAAGMIGMIALAI
jgi:hypothetical protein